MAASAQPSPQNSYVATEIFHYPGGVAMPGETVSLDPDTAERGVAAGVLYPTPNPVVKTDPDPTASKE